MKPFVISAILISSLVSAIPAAAVRHEPFDRSRIYWDNTTRCVPISSPSGYGRLIQLQDGRLLMMGGAWSRGVESTYSSDHGKTWTAPQVVLRHTDKFEYCNPDFIQLADGTLLLGVNPRPIQPYSEDRRFSIDVLRSTDNGLTWSEMIRLHTASHIGEDGCWEPAFLELPSGEVHCYFSLELENSNDQQIMMCRSFDNGVTWTPAQRVSYRAGSRDGMPVAILTDNNEIVFTIEDNGQPGYNGFRATTIRCTLEQNWYDMWVDGGSSLRSKMLVSSSDLSHLSAGPYIRKLPTGETVASWMGEWDGIDGKGIDYYHHLVAVGDADARNFKCTNHSFYVPEGGRASWGSINVDNDGYVYAIAGTYAGGQTEGNALIRGRALKGFEAPYGTPKLDGVPTKDAWTYDMGRQLTMGSQTGNRMEMDFLYDDENFYFYAYAADPEIRLDEAIDKDGIFLWLDVAGCCDTHPQKGMYKLFFGVDGTVSLRRGETSKWQPEELQPQGIVTSIRSGRTYYMIEAAIPWSLLGEQGAPEASRPMRINVMQRDIRTRGLFNETIPEATDKSSWTWPELTLGENTGIDAAVSSGDGYALKVSGRCVSAEGCASAIVEAYAPSGIRVASSTGSVSLPGPGIYVVRAVLPSGVVLRRRVAVK